MRLSLVTIFLVLLTTLVSAATENAEIVRVRPITREEYNEILKLTNGKTTISEARLISSGLAVLKNLATYTTRFWPNFWSVFGITQTTSTGIVADTENSYPLCVVSTVKQNNIVGYGEDISNLAGMDCIIVVRNPQEEEEEENNYEDPYCEDQEPISMLPDYQHYPYATIQPQHPYPYPPAIPPPPYQPYPYAAYHPYPYYSPYAGYSHLPMLPQYLQQTIPQFPQQEIPQSMEGQQQNQYQTEADYYHQPNFAHFSSPFYAPPLPPAPQPNFNQNAGPIVHVIRGDKRDIGQQRNKAYQKRGLSKAKRSRRRVFRNSMDNNGYAKTTVPRQQYSGQSYPKVSHSRSEPYDGPVYIMTADNLYKQN